MENQIVLFSEHDYENELLHRVYLANPAFHATLKTFSQANVLTLGLLKSNFFKLDRVVRAFARQAGIASPNVPPPFSVTPLWDLGTRFETYLGTLRGHRLSERCSLDVAVYEEDLRPFLRAVMRARHRFEEKDLLMAMGTICDAVFTGPFRLMIDPSTHCNIDCIFCKNFSSLLGAEEDGERETVLRRPRKMLDFELLRRTLDDAARLDVKRLSLVGGAEPTTVPYFSELCRELARVGIPVDMSTNGTLLHQERGEEIIDSGVFGSIDISVSAASQETYRQVHPHSGSRWPALLSNIAHLSRTKRARGAQQPYLYFVFVVNRLNVHELERAVELAAELGCDWIKFQLLHASHWNRKLMLTPSQVRLLPERVESARLLAERRGLKWWPYVLNQVDDLNAGDGTWSSFIERRGCMVGWGFSFLSYQGQVLFCCGDREVLRADTTQKSFAQVWQSDRYRYMRQVARFLDPRMNVRCDNAFRLLDDYCQSCDNHQHQHELVTLLQRTGLQRFASERHREGYVGDAPARIDSLEVENAVERTESGVMVLSGLPLLVRLRVTPLAVRMHIHVHVTLRSRDADTPGEDLILGECWLPMAPDAAQRGGALEARLEVPRLALTDHLDIRLEACVAFREGEMGSFFDKSRVQLPLRIASDPSLGQGLVPLRHGLEITSVWPAANQPSGLGKQTGRPVRFVGFRTLDGAGRVQRAAKSALDPETGLTRRRAFLRRGEPCRLELTFTCREPVSAPLVQLELHMEQPLNSVLFFQTSTEQMHSNTNEVYGKTCVALDFLALDLPAGSYYCVLSVRSAGILHRALLLRKEINLEVTDEAAPAPDPLHLLHWRVLRPLGSEARDVRGSDPDPRLGTTLARTSLLLRTGLTRALAGLRSGLSPSLGGPSTLETLQALRRRARQARRIAAKSHEP